MKVDGRRKCHARSDFFGNPCDALDVTESIKGIETVCIDRGASTKRVVQMTMSALIKVCEFIETCVATNILSLEEGV